MKKLLLLVALAASTLPLVANDRIRDVQTELKTQGFYYGEIDGRYSTETTAALRRYQIRNGLEVTGTLTDETIKSLGLGGSNPAPSQPPAVTPQAPRPPLEESDRNFLRREEARERAQATPPPVRREPPPVREAPAIREDSDEDPSYVPAPRRLEAPSADFPVLFAGTPYATAPREVQEATLRQVQRTLAARGFYREAIDGEPGPATEEAILAFQRSSRLRLTGQLDLSTMNALRILPGRSAEPLRGSMAPPSRSSEPPTYRGIWVR